MSFSKTQCSSKTEMWSKRGADYTQPRPAIRKSAPACLRQSIKNARSDFQMVSWVFAQSDLQLDNSHSKEL